MFRVSKLENVASIESKPEESADEVESETATEGPSMD